MAGLSYALRQQVSAGAPRRRRRDGGRPPARRGRDRSGEDQLPGVSLQLRNRQLRYRAHATILGIWSDSGRIERRRGGGDLGVLLGGWDRQRRRRLDPHPRALLRHRGIEADAGARFRAPDTFRRSAIPAGCWASRDRWRARRRMCGCFSPCWRGTTLRIRSRRRFLCARRNVGADDRGDGAVLRGAGAAGDARGGAARRRRVRARSRIPAEAFRHRVVWSARRISGGSSSDGYRRPTHTAKLIAGREADAHWTSTEFLMPRSRQPEPTAQRGARQTRRARSQCAPRCCARWTTCPVLLLPACGVTAWKHRERRWETGAKQIGLFEAMMPATFVNLLGLPAVTIP